MTALGCRRLRARPGGTAEDVKEKSRLNFIISESEHFTLEVDNDEITPFALLKITKYNLNSNIHIRTHKSENIYQSCDGT